MTALKLSIACDPFELVRGLHDGSVPIEGIDLQFQPEMTNPVRHKAMVRDLAFDICELNICTYLIAKEAGLPLTALPVFLFRKFRHGNIFINPDGPVRKPEDLAGVRIGCPNLQAAAVIWASGILQDAFGVDQRAPTWVTERDEDLRFEVPHDLKLERVSPGANLVDMLLKDEIGALITPQIPQAFLDRHPKIKRLFPDYRTREEAYFHESGLFPIMHVTAVRSELIEAHPWIAGRLMKGFETSKVQAYERFSRDRTIPLAWFGARWEEERQSLGDDPWAYGLGSANRLNLDMIVRYTQRQGLISKAPSIDTLFVNGISG